MNRARNAHAEGIKNRSDTADDNAVTLRAPLWLAHHHQDQLDRCALVGRTHVCRRCLWSYPACIAVLSLSLAGLHWPPAWDAVLGWGLPLAGVADFIGENIGVIRYSARRQAWLSLIAGIAFGRGLGRYLDNPGDGLFWTVAITYGAAMALAFAWHRARTRTAALRQELADSDASWAHIETQMFGPPMGDDQRT